MNKSERIIAQYFRNNKRTRAVKGLTFGDLVGLADPVNISIGPKDEAVLITPYVCESGGKKKDDAETGTFHLIVIDYDDVSLNRRALADLYRREYGLNCLIYSTSSYSEKCLSFKVLIPLNKGIDHKQYERLAKGIAHRLGTDPKQTNIQQGFYAPNITKEDNPYHQKWLNPDVEWLDPDDHTHPFINDALEGLQALQLAEAKAATPKPRDQQYTTGKDGGIVELILERYSLAELIAGYGYIKRGSAWLSPKSKSGMAGVRIFKRSGKEVLYSHHGLTDELSAQHIHHGGHSLDAADVLCALKYGNNFSKMIGDEADLLDWDGQKRRQVEYAIKDKDKKLKEEAQQTREELDQAEPVDIFGGFELPDFDLDLLPDAFVDFVRDNARIMGVDPAVIGMGTISAAAACIDDRVKVELNHGWKESARLWVGIVAEPGSMKSGGLNKAVAPIKSIDRAWEAENLKKLTEWKKACKATPKGENEPPRPILKSLLIDDVTTEKLGVTLADSEPRGVFVYRDELSGWLGSMDAYRGGTGSKDKSAWIQAYEGDYRKYSRIGREDKLIDNWSASILGGIQPEVIDKYANSTERDGLLQRFILVYAQGTNKWKRERLDDFTSIGYSLLLARLSALEGRAPVQLSPQAFKIFNTIDDYFRAKKDAIDTPELKAVFSKWSGLFGRLVLVYHCVESITSRRHPSDFEVSEKSAKKVANLMTAILLPHAMKFYEPVDRIGNITKKLAGLLLVRKVDRFTVKRFFDRYFRSEAKDMTPYEINAVLDRLESSDWIAPEPKIDAATRRPVGYMVNSKIYGKFEDQAREERKRRKKAVAQINAAKTGERLF